MVANNLAVRQRAKRILITTMFLVTLLLTHVGVAAAGGAKVIIGPPPGL